MSQALEVPELAKRDGVPQVEIGPGGIEAELYDERRGRRPRSLQLGDQLLFG